MSRRRESAMLNPFRWSFRAQYFAGFAACISLLVYAHYVQFYLEIEPCPLCIFQRIAFYAMALFFLIGALHNPGRSGRSVYALLVLLGAAAGVGIAAYHLWVQHLPPDPFAGCAPGWTYMVDNFPLNKILKMAFAGHADCAEVSWTFLGLAMPFWTLVSFVLIGAGAVWAGLRGRTGTDLA
jgi:disulfide bond formation protein DsbB